jgi:hypothetical protein
MVERDIWLDRGRVSVFCILMGCFHQGSGLFVLRLETDFPDARLIQASVGVPLDLSSRVGVLFPCPLGMTVIIMVDGATFCPKGV